MRIKYIETLPSGRKIWSEYFIKNHKPHKIGDIVDGFEVIKIDKFNSDLFIYHIKDVRDDKKSCIDEL